MIQVNRIYLIFNRLVTKKFLVDTSDSKLKNKIVYEDNEIYDAGAPCRGPAYILH